MNLIGKVMPDNISIQSSQRNQPGSSSRNKTTSREPQSIKHKLTIRLLAVYLLISLATVFALFSLSRVEAKISVIKSLDTLSQKVLETRRYEKNYLLYGNGDDLRLALDYLAQVRAEVTNLRSVEAFPLEDLPEYEKKLENYAAALHKLNAGTAPQPQLLLQDEVHRAGHAFTTHILEQDNFIRQEITEASLHARKLSQVILGLALILGILLTIYIIRRIVTPLEFICRAAARIMDGEMSTIPMVPGQDRSREEIELVDSLNLMLRFLETKQNQLVQSAKLATIGKVTAGIAHEINNPLNNIYLTAEVLLEDLPNIQCAERLEMANDILNQADRAREVVHHLLAFSRTRQSTNVEKIDLVALLQQTLVFLKNQIRIGQITVNSEILDQPIMVNGNANQLQQVFVNIILNGIQAMGRGGLLSITVSKTEGQTGLILIKDNGPGIPDKVMQHIFDPFFTTKSEGTGLGLSVSNSIIEEHHGRITLSSEQGSGTTFSISLPLAENGEDQ